MLKGAHAVDPRNGLIEMCAHSAGVVGPDGAICGAFATVLMVDDVYERKWIGCPGCMDCIRDIRYGKIGMWQPRVD